MAHSTVQTAQPFICPDFLLDGEHARKLFHEVADELPIIDYHSPFTPCGYPGEPEIFQSL